MIDNRLFKVLENAQADALLITSPSNTFYYSEYINPECTILVTKSFIHYYTDKRYSLEASKHIPENYVIFEEACSNFELIAEHALKEGIKSVAFENLSYQDYCNIKKYFPEVELFDKSDVVSQGRACKSDLEISRISYAAHCNDVAFEALLGQVKEGMTELELGYLLQYEYIKAGGDGIAFDTISVFGEHTAYPHGHSGNRKLRYGDMITLDFGTKYMGYCSDITRSFCFGEPYDKDYKKFYSYVLEAHKLSAESVKVGMKCFDADKVARDYLTSKGLGDYFTHSLGHGVGVDIHEKPFLSKRSSDVFEEGNIFTIEPGIYIGGKFGIRIEDTLVLKDGNPVTLNRCDKNLIIL